MRLLLVSLAALVLWLTWDNYGMWSFCGRVAFVLFVLGRLLDSLMEDCQCRP